MRIALICGASAIALTTAAFAVNSSISTLRDIETFAMGTAPDSVTKKTAASTLEKPAAVIGSNYAVITGAVDRLGTLDSYIRLYNGGALATNFSLTIVNTATGATVGSTVNMSIPPLASRQTIMRDILTQAAPGTAGGGTYAIYIQSPEATAGYQHVVYNSFSDLFENASLCKMLLNEKVASVANSIVMINVHTSLLDNIISPGVGYPMRIEFHNYADTAKSYVAKVYDAYSGTLKGQVQISAAANTSYTFPFTSSLQNAAGVSWTPSAANNEYWANVVITDSAGAVPNATVGAVVDTSRKLGTAASSNMSMACAVNTTSSPAGGGGVTDPGGGFGSGDGTY